jgi:hypothetical protein
MQNENKDGIRPIQKGGIFYIVGYLFYISYRIVIFRQLVSPAISPDTPSFISVSMLSLLDPGFWDGAKPFLYPLLIKILGHNLEIVPIVQLLISIAAWGFLAYAFSSHFNNLKFKVLSFTIILLFSTNVLLDPWDAAIMSESLSFSLMALLIGLWLYYIKHETWPVTCALILVSCFWIFVRDTNAWIGLAISGSLFSIWLLRKSPQVLSMSSILLFAFVLNYFLGGLIVNMDQRWVIPLLNVVEKRILKNPERVDFFEAHRMPVTPALMAMKDQDYNGHNNAFYNAPELASFRDWLLSDGRKTYILFLLHDPNYLLTRPFADVGYLNEDENNDIYQPALFSYPLLPSWINEIVLINMVPRELVLGSFVIAGIALAFLFIRRNGFWLILTLTILLVYPHLVVAWQGDSAGLSRHTLLANLQLRLVIWMLLLAIMNEVFSWIGKLNLDRGSGQ